MAYCLAFSQVTDGTPNDGIFWEVFRQVTTPVEDCAKTDISERVILTGMEYQELLVRAGEVATLDQAVSALDPSEISAVFGTTFAMMVFLGFVGYKIALAKRVIKNA